MVHNPQNRQQHHVRYQQLYHKKSTHCKWVENRYESVYQVQQEWGNQSNVAGAEERQLKEEEPHKSDSHHLEPLGLGTDSAGVPLDKQPLQQGEGKPKIKEKFKQNGKDSEQRNKRDENHK